MNKMKFTSDRRTSFPSREESLASEVDDLTVIAEFDYPSDEDQINSYQITSPFEIVGFSLANGSKHATLNSDYGVGGLYQGDYNVTNSHFQDFGYDKQPRVISQKSEDFVDSNIYEKKGVRQEDLKSTGIQATITYNSRATSPFASVDHINNRNVNHDVNAPFATLFYPEVEFIRYELLRNSDFDPKTKHDEVLQNMFEEKSTNTESFEKDLDRTDKYSMTDFSIFDKRDNSTLTRSLVTRNMASSTDVIDSRLLEQSQKDKPVLKQAVGSQALPLVGSIGIQVAMDEETDRNHLLDLENSMSQTKHWQSISENFQTENDELKELVDIMKSEIAGLRDYPEKVRILEDDKNKMEKSLLDMENRLKNVLDDSESDTKFIRSKLEKAIADLEAKDVHVKEMSTQLDDYKARQSNLEKVIKDLKLHLKNKDSHDQKMYEELEAMSDNFANKDINLNVKSTLPDDHTSDEYEVLLRKYNNLRTVASKLQTSVSPLKAKLGLASKKCRRKDELLKKLIECDEVPKHLKNEVEDNLKDNDHYRALSPLTLTHINRLEHDLFNHIYEKIPYFGHVDEAPLNKISLSSGELLNGNAPEDLLYETEKSVKLSNRIQKPLSVEDDLFANIGRRTQHPQLSHGHEYPRIGRHSDQIMSNRKMKLHDPIADFSTRNHDEPFRMPLGRTNPISSVPPPQNFRIDDILEMKRFLFCWEPAQTRQASIVGYELRTNGVKKDFIPGVLTSKYTLNFPSNNAFPAEFELSSVRSDGKMSDPARIVVHGLQKINRNKNNSASLKVGLRNNAEYQQTTEKSEADLSNKNMYVAFYDYTPSGFSFTKDGITYSELGFKTGNIIETFGDALPNGYVFGKVAESSQLGLIPMTFLEKIPKV